MLETLPKVTQLQIVKSIGDGQGGSSVLGFMGSERAVSRRERLN